MNLVFNNTAGAALEIFAITLVHSYENRLNFKKNYSPSNFQIFLQKIYFHANF